MINFTPEFSKDVPIYKRGTIHEWHEAIRECIRHRKLPFLNNDAVTFFISVTNINQSHIIYDAFYLARDDNNFNNLMIEISNLMGISWNGILLDPETH